MCIRDRRAPQALAAGSETLLGLFEQLSTHYEHSMQMLMGQDKTKG